MAIKQAPVKLSPYDPIWKEKFEKEREFLKSKIGEFLVGAIEHVGSTAVPGLIAKPVIDIMFGVRSLSASEPAIKVLEANGYRYSAYKADVMHWLCKPSQAFRTHHLHLVPYRSHLWDERIRFRDLLRSDEKIASDYSVLKTTLAERYPEDREAYTSEKWPFIKRVLEMN